MRITMTAVAFAGSVGLVSPCPFAAAADGTTNLTMYGIIDAGFVHESGGARGSIDKITSGANSMSRIGFRGSEDLGDGLSAILGLESGIKIDTGELDAANTLFNRQAYVGLKSTRYGTLTFGRQYSPWYTTIYTMADPFGTSLAGNVKNLFPTGGLNARISNSALYVSPTLRGVSFEFAYGLGEQAGGDSAGRQLGFAAAYQQGPLHVRYAYLNRNNDTAAVPATGGGEAVAAVHRSSTNISVLAANYDFGFIKPYLTYEIDRGFGAGVLPNANAYGGVPPTPSTDAREVVIGFTAPVPGGKLIASHVRKDDRTAFDQDAIQWGIGYQYFLSKRTLLYTSFASIRNRNGAGYTVGNGGESGSGNRGFNMGVRLTF